MRAIKDQLDRIAHGYRYNFSSDALEELTGIIRRRCGGTLNNMVYVTGGSEAVEILPETRAPVSQRRGAR